MYTIFSPVFFEVEDLLERALLAGGGHGVLLRHVPGCGAALTAPLVDN